MMNGGGSRSSQSSYGDPRHLSDSSFVSPPPPSKVLLEGYRDVLDPANEEKPRYNPVCDITGTSSSFLTSRADR